MPVIQTPLKVIVAGQDVTSRFQPLLERLTVERSAGKAADSASLLLDNSNSKIAIPADRAPIQVFIAGQWVFEGFVTEVQCNLDKGSGRTLEITASSVDQGSKAKEPALRHKDNATLASVAAEFGEKAGIQVSVSGSIASLQRDYWLQQNESFISWGQRMAREVGGTFKVIGTRAFLTARNEGLSSSGRPLTTIEAAEGRNLLSASIRPIVSRPRFKNVRISYFEKVEEEIETGIADVDATLRHLIAAATKDQAKSKAEAHGKESDRDKGQGDVTILGDARAEPEALCIVSGVAQGADGAYRIDSLSHRVDKRGGFVTSLTLRQPQSAGSGGKTPVGSSSGAPPSAIGVGPR
jgi:uncharacterized protein